MKSIFFSIALAALSFNAFAQDLSVASLAVPDAKPKEITSLKIGAALPMPTAMLKTIDGKAVTLAEAKTDGGLLVMFSCNTCPYVVKSQQRTQEAIKMAKEMNVGMVIINSNEAQRGDADSYNAMADYAKMQNYSVPYAIDDKSAVADAFGATRTPEVYLFNGKGTLVYKGAMEDNPSDPASSKQMYLAAALKNMKSGGKIAPAETKSIGCSIKRM